MKNLALLVGRSILWLLVIIVLHGCKGGGSSSSGPVSKTMKLHMTADPMGFNPLVTTGAEVRYAQNLIFERLLILDPESLSIQPQLADSLPRISEDKLSLTFHLNPNASFSDGKPVRSSDVLFSFKALMNPLVESDPHRSELTNLKDCTILDSLSFRIHLWNSGPFTLSRLAVHFYILPKHIYDPQNLTDAYSALQGASAVKKGETGPSELYKPFADFFQDQKFNREKGSVVGSGRYIFDSWEPGSSIRLIKNTSYWNSASKAITAQIFMDTLVYKIITDVGTAFASLKSGEIDFSDAFEPAQFTEEMQGESFDSRFKKKAMDFPFYEYIGWNIKTSGSPNRDLFGDKRVRQALAHLVDVGEIIENVMYGTATPIQSMVYHKRPEYNSNLKAIPYDEEKAKALLSEAGWEDHDADGILDKTINGEKIKFSFSLCYRQGNSIRQSIGRIVQESCKKVGIEVEVKGLEWNIMLEKLKKHEIDAWIAAWAYDSDEQDYYSLFHSTQRNNGYNFGRYSNPNADAVMEKILVEWDQNARFELHKQIQAILHEDQPYTLLFSNSARIAYSNRIDTDHWFGQRPCYDPGLFYPVGGKEPK